MSIQKTYWDLLLEATQKALEKHYFAVSRHETLGEATSFLAEELAGPEIGSVGFGGSASVGNSDLMAKLKAKPHLKIIDRNNHEASPAERQEMSRQCLLADLFVASANAVTLTGEVVNLDKFGNRVAAIAFGPKKVALLVGREKIRSDLTEAKNRVKNLASPMNALRLKLPTPCSKTGHCHDCQGETRICGVWQVVERSFPKGRIHILLVNEEIGF
ncbi:MAG: lactate utilization protein [Deltaproteobacteria bacterium]|nr:lactate utilization protein [Deltaproteobacteria bacterium]